LHLAFEPAVIIYTKTYIVPETFLQNR